MKKYLFLLLLLALSPAPYAFAQQYGWVDISANMPVLGGFNDVHVIGEEVWITGGNDEVFYTPDRGETFIIQSLPPLPGNDGITSSVFMKNSEEGYVVTFSGEINKTNDGGANWYLHHDPGGTLLFVHFPPTHDFGFTCGNNGKIWKFNNENIVDISPSDVVSELHSIIFPVSSNEGKVCGESLIKRYLDNTWINLQLYDNGYFFNSIYFTDNNNGWAVGTNGTILHTSDGVSWIMQSINTTIELNDIFFITPLEGWAVGYDVLLHTEDGGTTWIQEATELTNSKILRAVYFTDSNNGYVVGNNTVLKYTELTTGSEVPQESEALKFEIHPNPAAEKFRVQCSELCPSADGFKVEDTKIEICDLNGRKFLEKHITTGTETIEIDVSNLQSGVYFCKLITEKYSVTRKIIIQK